MPKTAQVNATGNDLIDGVFSGVRWRDSAIEYAFPLSAKAFGYAGEPDHNFSPFNLQLKNAALYTLEQDFGSSANNSFSVEGFTKLGLSLGDGRTAEVRFGFSSDANPTAYAYYPDEGPWGGDVWMGTSEPSYRKPVQGNDAWLGIMHEIGHALGLKHGHQAESGFGTLPADKDSLEYSIMTYNTFVGDDAGSWKYEIWGAPQTFMMSDIAALQRMYGADFTANAGNTVYRWRPDSGDTLINGKVAIDPGANRIFATIWDGDGIDTYNLSAYSRDLDIDLRPGSYSVFASWQRADLNAGADDGNVARGNIFNALLFKGDTRSLIENAVGGSGDDDITGNLGANVLKGLAGEDMLAGLGGDDSLVGGFGRDIFVFYQGYDHDTVLDFRRGDRIDFRRTDLADTSEALSMAQQDGANTVFDFGSGDVLELANVDAATLRETDFLIA